MLIDSHCHINKQDFESDIDAILINARQNDVQLMLNVACCMTEIEPILDLCASHPQILASVGIHPHEAAETLATLQPDTIYNYLKPFTNNPKVIAIGETGFDFYYNHSPKAEQEQSFRQQIELAIDSNLPVIVHTRDAEPETVNVLKDYAGQLTGVIHCFSGSQWLAEQCLDLGFYISFSGILTFPKAADLRAVAQTVSMNRLLLETDAPYLAPVPKRGKRNEPAFIQHTAALLADLKSCSLNDMAAQTTDNFLKLFTKAYMPLSPLYSSSLSIKKQ